jgi:hypothetical protein
MPDADGVDFRAGLRIGKRRATMKKAKRPAARKAAARTAGKKRKPIMRHGRDGVRAASKRAKPAAKPAAGRSSASHFKRQ